MTGLGNRHQRRADACKLKKIRKHIKRAIATLEARQPRAEEIKL